MLSSVHLSQKLVLHLQKQNVPHKLLHHFRYTNTLLTKATKYKQHQKYVQYMYEHA